MSNDRQHRPEERPHAHEAPPLRASMNYEEPGHAYPHPDRELTPKELAAAATARRLAREEAFIQTTPVAGHDFRREHEDRERGR